jgi:predicted TIM-barrel fold metal-dependent hydrolase
VLFDSDSPFDPQKGETIKIIDELPISDSARKRIYQTNVERLLNIAVG